MRRVTPDDLKAGKVEVAIMGAYTDMSTGMRGAQHGPNALRNSEVYGGWGVVELPHMQVMVDLFKALTMVDYGDAPIDIMSAERSVHAIRSYVRQAAEVEYEPNASHMIPYEKANEQFFKAVKDFLEAKVEELDSKVSPGSAFLTYSIEAQRV